MCTHTHTQTHTEWKSLRNKFTLVHFLKKYQVVYFDCKCIIKSDKKENLSFKPLAFTVSVANT